MSEQVLSTTAQVTPQAEVSPEVPAQAAAEAPKVEAKAPAAEPAKAEAAKTEAPKADAPVVPEKYDLKLAKESLLDPKAIERISSYAREKGLSNEQAQVLLDRESQAVADHVARQSETLSQRQKEWAAQLQNDKEIGGKAFQENVEYAKRAVEKFGSEAFKKELNDTGLGNHPELVRAFAKIGRAMRDDSLVNAPSQITNKKSAQDVLYGSSKEN